MLQRPSAKRCLSLEAVGARPTFRGPFRPAFPLLLLAFTVTCVNASPPVDAHPPESRELTNLRAFARLYGVLRFFHPSDEAAALDWNRYAVLGVARVRGARDVAELEAALEKLIVPIAPTVQILGRWRGRKGSLAAEG